MSTSNRPTISPVHDLTYRSPITLKEIAAITLAVEICREPRNFSRVAEMIDTHLDLALADEILPKEVIPNARLVPYDLLYKFITKSESSIARWVKHHSCKVFGLDYDSYTETLKIFNDFEWDWSCSIDHVRTAKRMMLSDRLTNCEKFKTACLHCLEDDIRRIWPLVSSDMDSVRIDFYRNPVVFYWICHLQGEQPNIGLLHREDDPIDEVMLERCTYESYSSVQYFWSHIPYERQPSAAYNVSSLDFLLVARYILPKLDDAQLTSFLIEGCVDFMVSLLTERSEAAIYVFRAWMHIRNKINQTDFNRLIKKLLEEEGANFYPKERMNSEDPVYLCCEVWKHSPENLKQLALNYVLLNELFTRIRRPPEPKEMRFLITLLLDASYELRHDFLRKNWDNILTSGACLNQLQIVMKLCFRNENDMSLFKEQNMSKYENIGPYCVHLLEHGCFKELNEFLSFCHSNEQKTRELKQQLLRTNFLGDNYPLRYKIDGFSSENVFDHSKQLNVLMEEAFETSDLRADFKNQFLSSSMTRDYLFDCIDRTDFGSFIEFINTLQDEQAVIVLKQRSLARLKQHLAECDTWRTDGDNLKKILVWLLGSKDEISGFKQSLSVVVDDIICNMIQFALENPLVLNENWDANDEDDILSMQYPYKLDDFLKWVLNNDAEEIRKVKVRHSDKLKVFDH